MNKIFNFNLSDYTDEYYKIYDRLKNINLNTIPSFKSIKNFLNVSNGDIVLDAGCGDGHLLHYIIDGEKAKGIGIDLSDIALQLSNENFKGNSYSKQDIRNIAFKDLSFDKILCFNVIEHIYEQEKVMGEFKRILKDDGILVIGTNIKNSLQWHLYQRFIDDHTHIKEFTIREFIAFVGRYFKIINYRKSSGVFRFSPPLSWLFHYVLKGDILLLCQKY